MLVSSDFPMDKHGRQNSVPVSIFISGQHIAILNRSHSPGEAQANRRLVSTTWKYRNPAAAVALTLSNAPVRPEAAQVTSQLHLEGA